MRFIENGPDIPDDLLLALDEGRVVFFCGSGVSRAKADLPDFFGLAERVLKSLGVSAEDPAAKILDEARRLEKRTGVPGLISADRVFGMLEKDFLSSGIEGAVAKELMPSLGADLVAHNILLDLATTKEGKTKLVTTNFDRLFDDCGRNLRTWQPPRLPDPARAGELDGIVYLHGRATENYDGSEGDGFVLSSSEFGRAYLAEGWATNFFKEIIERYAVVFVGYSADDPPVQYLLEALNKTYGMLSDVYAFQSGNHDEASARWQQKGVTAIPYNSEDKHSALWSTLSEWAQRVQDPELWRDKTVELAQAGPEKLSPFQREQVTHLVSTKEGARKFFESEMLPPATWLSVFDRTMRFGRPREVRGGDGDKKIVDPFALYGLASDPVPTPIEINQPKDYLKSREIPTGAWDAFELNRRDRAELRDEHVASLRGGQALSAGRLPGRLSHLGNWISNTAEQNAAVWWAVRQHGLHPEIQQSIKWKLQRNDSECAPNILQAWHYLFDDWRSNNDNDQLDWYRFADEIKILGWNKTTVRKYENLSRPRISVMSNNYHDAVPPQKDESVSLGRLLLINVVVSEERPEIEVPNEWLRDVVAARKRNLDIAIQLETERGLYDLLTIPPIMPSDDPSVSDYQRTEGVTGEVLRYAKMFERLLELQPIWARQEVNTWSDDDENIYARLRIWASRFTELVPDEVFGDFFSKISRNAFWNTEHQRDLLLSLKKRWAKLPMTTTRELEARIIEGRARGRNEAEHEYVKRNAWLIADRLQWLKNNDCKLSMNFEMEIQRLQIAAPDWKSEYADNADRSLESRSGTVQTETDFSALLEEPLSNLLRKAQELGGRTEDLLVERDPFAGLCESRPAKSVSALRLETKIGQYPNWAWRRFLNTSKRKEHAVRIKVFVANLLIAAPDNALEEILYPVTDWLLACSDALPSTCVETYQRLVERLIRYLVTNPDAGSSGIVRGNSDPDWATEALNSPAGKIAQALYNDPRHKNLVDNQRLPHEWVMLVEATLKLHGDNARFALIFFTHNLNWFYRVDPEWTQKNLLSILGSKQSETIEAWWAGYLWGIRGLPNFELFQTIKPYLMEKVIDGNKSDRDDRNQLAGIILSAWGHPEPDSRTERITDSEFRELLLRGDDHFRSRVLWQLERWSGVDGENGRYWRDLRLRFINEVWPIQTVARTPINSARLIELAFSDDETFMEISSAILPLISPIERDHIILPSIRRNEGNIVDKYPERVLEMLFAALPEDANSWPYEIDATLERIKKASDELRQDVRLIELLRRWNAR